MKCPRCEERNGPAAMWCRNCEAPLREDEAGLSPDVPPPPRRGAATAGAIGAALLVLVVLGAARGGDWLGQWFVRNAPARPLDSQSERDVLLGLHERWKQAHALPVEALMEMHAPHARIIFFNGQPQPLSYLKDLATSVRQTRTYNSVSDVQPPQVLIEGPRATITARHRYGHSNPQYSPVVGDRVLVWENIGGRWLIVEDRYKPTSTVPPPPPSRVLEYGSVER